MGPSTNTDPLFSVRPQLLSNCVLTRPPHTTSLPKPEHCNLTPSLSGPASQSQLKHPEVSLAVHLDVKSRFDFFALLGIARMILGNLAPAQFCTRARLSGAQLSSMKKWTVGPYPGAQLSTETRDCWAQLSTLLNVGGTTVQMPNYLGSDRLSLTIRGPICLEPPYTQSILRGQSTARAHLEHTHS